MPEQHKIQLQSQRTNLACARWQPKQRKYDTTHCQTVTVTITVEAVVRNGQWAVHVEEGGVTGYECFYIDTLLNRPPGRELVNGLPWCAGTPGAWDRLVTPQPEVEKLLQFIRALPAVA